MQRTRLLHLAIILLLALPLTGLAAEAVPAPGAGGTVATVSGQILTVAGEPLSGGVVHFFSEAAGPPPSPNLYWRVPDYMRRLDEQGRFTMQLPEGTYYLGAIKRASGKGAGPPQEGDLFFVVSDPQGKPLPHRVAAGIPLDMGRLAGAAPFHRKTLKGSDTLTAIEGSIIDGEGKLVANAHVFAFLSPSAVGRPLFVADPTGKDGRFLLRVAEGGDYFLKVRGSYGGAPPASGELIGNYGEKAPVQVTVKKGERLSGITITVQRVPGRLPEAGAK